MLNNPCARTSGWFSRQLITSSRTKSFQGLTMTSLNLSSTAWNVLQKNRILDMAGNQLTAIPSDLPESLEYLYLQNNKITTVPEDAFDSTPNIKGIYLRFNKIAFSAVKESTFQRLRHLQVLDIEGNFEFSGPLKNGDNSDEEMEEDEEGEQDVEE